MRFLPRFLTGLRARLVLAFFIVTVISLALIVATLPRLLDGYFEQQSTADLARRAGSVKVFVSRYLVQYQNPPGQAARAILAPTDPISADDGLKAWLGTADKGQIRELAETIALANVTIRIYESNEAEQPAFELFVPFPDELAVPGQEREPITSDARIGQIDIPDTFWTQSG